MRSHPLLLALLMLLPPVCDVAAQSNAKPAPPVEDVTVTGARTRQAIAGFVQSLATPTRAAGKVARWEKGICPTALGLKAAYLNFIIKRLKDVAAQTGAPIDNSSSCETNVVIVFTTKPQALVDNVKKQQPGFLGFYDNHDQLDKLATVTRPIQAWYTTATQDTYGKITMDSGRTLGQGLEIYLPCSEQGFGASGMCLLHLPNAHAAASTETRLGDGLKSGLYNVIIVADPTRLVDYEMGPLADYIALLALAQIGSPDGCQQLPSILNLLAKDCPSPPDALTANDLGYLSALYKMSPGSTIQVQRNEMTYQMQQSLGVR